MKLPEQLYIHAKNLRISGYSLSEIAKQLNISKSTASQWVKNIVLSKTAKQRIKKQQEIGKLKWKEISKKNRENTESENEKWANNSLSTIDYSREQHQLICALLYWAEGGKTCKTRLEFTNSDPKILQCFLTSLIKGFEFDMKRVKVNIHIHEYHNEKQLKKYWSKILGIPPCNFNKNYLKPHTKKRIKIGYNGCVRICYNSADTFRKVEAIYKNLNKHIGL